MLNALDIFVNGELGKNAVELGGGEITVKDSGIIEKIWKKFHTKIFHRYRKVFVRKIMGLCKKRPWASTKIVLNKCTFVSFKLKCLKLCIYF